MSFENYNPELALHCEASCDASCEAIRGEFSAYLDGAVSGVEMARIAGHLEDCAGCSSEFAAWRSVQSALSNLGPAKVPVRLQARLRAAVAAERERGTHLPLSQRFAFEWRNWLGSAALRVAGGCAAAVVLLGSAAVFLAGPLSVQANDDNMAHLSNPHYMYSQVPPRPLPNNRVVPVLVEAQVDTRGRVYDYSIVAGPSDPDVKLRVEENLLASVFKPATAFGIPVRGRVIVTYSGVSVRG